MKKFKIKYFKRLISFILIFSVLFSQNGVLVFADFLRSKNSSTLEKSLDKDAESVTEDTKEDSTISKDVGSYNNRTINNDDTIKPIEDIEKNTLKSSDSGELVSIGNLSMGKAILPKKLPKLVKGQLPFPDYAGGHYYNQLNLDKKIAYQVYLWLIENVAPLTYIDISALGLEINDFYAINQVVLMENPEIFHARDVKFAINTTNKKVTHIYYKSIFKLDEIRRMKKKLEDSYKLALANVKSSLKENYTRLDVVRAIHDYVGQTTYGAICEATVHPEPDHFSCPEFYKQHSIYGVFVERRGICEGFSYAFAKLAEEFGIPVLSDSGESKTLHIEAHTWNLVQMDDGKWYVNDPTADGKSNNRGENQFYNFLIGEKSNRLQHEHDPYLRGYNMHFQTQVYNIPKLSQENYIKINVKYPSDRVEFYRTFKDALEDIKRNDLPGNHKILLTDDYNLTSEEVELFKTFGTEKNISFEFSSIEDPWMMRKFSLGSEKGNLYLPNDTSFYNINYDIQNLYTQGNKVSFYGEITNIFGKNSDIYLGQKNGKASELEIEDGSFNKIYLAKDYEGSTNNSYSNDINFRMSKGSIKELYISDKDTITGNININISNLSSISNIYYGENINLDKSKKLTININGGGISQIVSNEKPIDANVDINFSGGRIGNITGPTVKSEADTKTTNIQISGGEILTGVYGEVGNTKQSPNNNILIQVKGISIPNIDVARATTGKGIVEVSGITNIANLIDFDEIKLLDNTYLKVNEEIAYSKNNNRLGKIIYSGSNSQINLPPKQTALKQLENVGNNNALIISKSNANISLLEAPILNNKLILKYFDGVKAKQGDKIIEFPSGYQIDLNKFENQIDLAYPLEIDSSKRFIILGDQKSVSYIDTMEGRYPYKGEWGKEHVVTSPKAKNGTSSSNISKRDEITLQEGKLPYKDFKGGYYYDQLKDLNKKIAYQLYC